MGHRWAQNIPDLLGGGTGATLASRILGLPGAILVNIIGTGGFADVWFEPPPGTEFSYIRNPLMSPDPLVNFPYGWDVEPDGPT